MAAPASHEGAPSFPPGLPQSHIPLHIPDFQRQRVLVAPICLDKSWWHPAIAQIYAQALPQNSYCLVCPPRPNKVSVFRLQSPHSSQLAMA